MPPRTKGQGGKQPPNVKDKTKTGGGGDDDDKGKKPTRPAPTPPQTETEDQEEQPVLKRREDLLRGDLAESRLPDEYEFSFDPASLVGSCFHKIENDEIVWEGKIVGEPRPGVYLVQVGLLDSVKNVQKVIPLDRMTGDDDGYEWRFFDTEEQATNARYAWDLTHNE